ncbi:hypothetical protein OROHE_012499 [Orobanche hederae]
MFLVRPGELHHQYCIYLNSTCRGRAHDQLRAVLRMLLEDLRSDLPILLLGTSSTPRAEICDNPSLIFSERNDSV